LQEFGRLIVQVRQCEQVSCPQFHRPYHSETEGAMVLPHSEFGLDVVALVGPLSYEELVALQWADPVQWWESLGEQAHVVLAMDELQPTVGHEVLWVIWDCLSGEMVLVHSLLGRRSWSWHRCGWPARRRSWRRWPVRMARSMCWTVRKLRHSAIRCASGPSGSPNPATMPRAS